MTLPADHPALSVFKSFFSAMNAWGAEMIDYYQSIRGRPVDIEQLERDRAIQRRKLEEIFEEYCEAGLKAKRLRDEGMAFDGDSPDYDLAHELIESVYERAGKIIVETKQTNKLRWKYRYELVDTERGWKIKDHKKRGSDENPAWRAGLL